MLQSVPPSLDALLQARDEVSRESAWSTFLGDYNDLLLSIARRTSFDHDGAMDRYAFMLQQLRHDGCRRLRAFKDNGAGAFPTWLVVVARRLCVDFHRHVHGRPQATEPSPRRDLDATVRRNLADFVAAEVDPDQLASATFVDPEAAVLAAERRQALQKALEELDVADRLLLTLRFEDDIPTADLAPMVGLQTRFQVHRRLKSVIAKLRRSLAANGIEDG
jgi:RNA polymerase sigma factor (sigma-70 family)